MATAILRKVFVFGLIFTVLFAGLFPQKVAYAQESTAEEVYIPKLVKFKELSPVSAAEGEQVLQFCSPDEVEVRGVPILDTRMVAQVVPNHWVYIPVATSPSSCVNAGYYLGSLGFETPDGIIPLLGGDMVELVGSNIQVIDVDVPINPTGVHVDLNRLTRGLPTRYESGDVVGVWIMHPQGSGSLLQITGDPTVEVIPVAQIPPEFPDYPPTGSDSPVDWNFYRNSNRATLLDSYAESGDLEPFPIFISQDESLYRTASVRSDRKTLRIMRPEMYEEPGITSQYLTTMIAPDFVNGEVIWGIYTLVMHNKSDILECSGPLSVYTYIRWETAWNALPVRYREAIDETLDEETVIYRVDLLAQPAYFAGPELLFPDINLAERVVGGLLLGAAVVVAAGAAPVYVVFALVP